MEPFVRGHRRPVEAGQVGGRELRKRPAQGRTPMAEVKLVHYPEGAKFGIGYPSKVKVLVTVSGTDTSVPSLSPDVMAGKGPTRESCVSHRSYDPQEHPTNTREARCVGACLFIHIEIPPDLHHHGMYARFCAPVPKGHIGSCEWPVWRLRDPVCYVPRQRRWLG